MEVQFKNAEFINWATKPRHFLLHPYFKNQNKQKEKVLINLNHHVKNKKIWVASFYIV